MIQLSEGVGDGGGGAGEGKQWPPPSPLPPLPLPLVLPEPPLLQLLPELLLVEFEWLGLPFHVACVSWSL
ncbi:MAG TPA: hypothetical protein VK386_03565 [Acidimicrobiales bacterium]|nr:hypothetical protein [Acidimicrobiales bacterium]